MRSTGLLVPSVNTSCTVGRDRPLNLNSLYLATYRQNEEQKSDNRYDNSIG